MSRSEMRVVKTKPSRLTKFLARKKLVLVMALSITGIVFAVSFIPYRVYQKKQLEVSEATNMLHQLQQENSNARKNIETLQTNAEIERIARQNFGLVRQGEEAYRVLLEPPVEEAVQKVQQVENITDTSDSVPSTIAP